MDGHNIWERVSRGWWVSHNPMEDHLAMFADCRSTHPPISMSWTKPNLPRPTRNMKTSRPRLMRRRTRTSRSVTFCFTAARLPSVGHLSIRSVYVRFSPPPLFALSFAYLEQILFLSTARNYPPSFYWKKAIGGSEAPHEGVRGFTAIRKLVFSLRRVRLCKLLYTIIEDAFLTIFICH